LVYAGYVSGNLLLEVKFRESKRQVGKEVIKMITDPVADMLTRIRNALRAGKEETEVLPASKLKIEILRILKKEGFINDFEVVKDGAKTKVKIFLRYDDEGNPVITEIGRISKPGRRVYVEKSKIPWIKNGLGIAILSTSKGVLTDREARKLGVGGELLLYVF
jgi:small subunit ribosomal protein S8